MRSRGSRAYGCWLVASACPSYVSHRRRASATCADITSHLPRASLHRLRRTAPAKEFRTRFKTLPRPRPPGLSRSRATRAASSTPFRRRCSSSPSRKPMTAPLRSKHAAVLSAPPLSSRSGRSSPSARAAHLPRGVDLGGVARGNRLRRAVDLTYHAHKLVIVLQPQSRIVELHPDILKAVVVEPAEDSMNDGSAWRPALGEQGALW